MVNPNKPIVNHKERGKSMRSHGTAMANSAKSIVNTYQKKKGKLGDLPWFYYDLPWLYMLGFTKVLLGFIMD